jgi:hypothetical protein
MTERKEAAESLPAKVKSEKYTLQSCINKVLARQFLRSMQSRMRRDETFDASPPVGTDRIEKIDAVLPLQTAPNTTVDSNLLI